jgi:uncharacterized protein YndB with AHSA1/START domain
MGTFEILDSTPECEIVTTRVFEWPRAVVFRAWAEPEHLKNWWGPLGFTNTFHTFEFTPGGRWIFTMHGPEKGNYENACTFIAIQKPELIVWDRQSKPLFQVEVRFEEVSPSTTRLTFKQKFATAEECSKLRKYVPEKNEENMDKLAEELTRMQAL